MALSASSLLFGWKAPWGLEAIGPYAGRPVFARAGSRLVIDRQKMLRTIVADVAGFEPGDDPAGGDLLSLQLARTNRVPYSDDFSQWSDSVTTVTPGQADPFGGTNARLLATDTAGGAHRRIALTLIGDGTKAVQIPLRKNTAAASYVGIFSNTASVWRHRVSVAWASDGSPTVTTIDGAGTVFDSIELTGGWWLIQFNATGVIAADFNELFFYEAALSTGSTYAVRAQVEDGAFPTSLVFTNGAAVARAADQMYWDNAPPPQPFIEYGRLIKGMKDDGGISASTISITGLNLSVAPLYQLYFSTGTIRAWYNNNMETGSEGVIVLPSDVGAVLEYGAVLHPNGAPRIIARVDGGAALEDDGAAPSFGIAATWSANHQWINSSGPATGFASNKYEGRTRVKFADADNVPGVASPDLVLDELADFFDRRLTPAGVI